MAEGSLVQRAMIATCIVVVVGSLTGLGLGRFATGGERVTMIDRVSDETVLGRSEALVADRAASDYAGPPTIIPTACEGCGPGLQERRALAQQREMEAMLARREAAMTRSYGEWEPDAEMPALRSFDEVAVTPPIVRPLEGASAKLIETSGVGER
jgi:hypothetical protein